MSSVQKMRACETKRIADQEKKEELKMLAPLFDQAVNFYTAREKKKVSFDKVKLFTQ